MQELEPIPKEELQGQREGEKMIRSLGRRHREGEMTHD